MARKASQEAWDKNLTAQIDERRRRTEHYYRQQVDIPCIAGATGSMRVRHDGVPLPFEAPRVAKALGLGWGMEREAPRGREIRLFGDCFAFANLAVLIGATCGNPQPQRRNAYGVTENAMSPIVDNRCGCAEVETSVLDFWDWPFLWGIGLDSDHRGEHEIRIRIPQHEAVAVKRVLTLPLPEDMAELMERRYRHTGPVYRGVWMTDFYSHPERRLYGHCHAIAYVVRDLEFGDRWGNDFSVLVEFLRRKLRTADCGCSRFGVREHDRYAEAAHDPHQWKIDGSGNEDETA
ncbi:MAG TPA: hypothetical protein VEB21_03200 [Terriglobales bacterium]|nr:hypothetical protein [Terriglobales bacterium]